MSSQFGSIQTLAPSPLPLSLVMPHKKCYLLLPVQETNFIENVEETEEKTITIILTKVIKCVLRNNQSEWTNLMINNAL